MFDTATLWHDSELTLFRDMVKKSFEREFVPHEERWREQHRADRSVWKKAGDCGLLCASIPEEYGGGGGNFLHEAIVAYEQAYSLVNSFSINVHSGILAHYILAFGSEPQKKRWLPAMATGDMVGAIALTEPGAGTDLQAIRTVATRKDGHYVLSGTKTFITNGYHADLICVAAKLDSPVRGKEVSLFMLETADLPGFRRGKLIQKIGQHGQDTIELFFDDIVVPQDRLLGEVEGKGFSQLMCQLPRERMLIAVGALGMMRRAVEETTRYVQERKAFGKPLMALQNTRFKLAECATLLAAAQAFVDQCIVRLMRNELDTATAAMAKWWLTHTNCQVIDECLQLHGGYGYTTEYPIGRMYVDSRIGKIYGGANEIMKELIARSLEA